MIFGSVKTPYQTFRKSTCFRIAAYEILKRMELLSLSQSSSAIAIAIAIAILSLLLLIVLRPFADRLRLVDAPGGAEEPP